MKRVGPRAIKQSEALTGLKQQAAAALSVVLDLVLELTRGGDWVDQDSSPLGRREHLAAVRRGDLRGYKVGRRVFVERQQLDDWIRSFPVLANDRGTTRVAVGAAPMEEKADDSKVAALQKTLGLVHVRGRRF